MPWTSDQVKNYIKGLNREERKKWANIANGILKNCQSSGGKDCENKAVRIANSKFAQYEVFNSVISKEVSEKIFEKFGGRTQFMKNLKKENEKIKAKEFSYQKETRQDPQDGHVHVAMLDNSGNGNTNMAGTPSHSHIVTNFIVQPWIGDSDNDDDIDYLSYHPGSLAYTETLGKIKTGVSKMQAPKKSSVSEPEDSKDDETQDGTDMSESSDDVSGKVGDTSTERAEISDSVSLPEDSSGLEQNKDGAEISEMEQSDNDEFMMPSDVHVPGTGEEEPYLPTQSMDLAEDFEMEIFRIGTHNGQDFCSSDLEEMASNFHALKDEVRPKLKITHHGEEQEQINLAGLASYGDVKDVYCKADFMGEQRLYAIIGNAPKEVAKWIQDRRFPERSIELYPNFSLGTGKGGEYRNVLKAIALLGSEMPAVTGMAPIKLSQKFEEQGTICFSNFCVCEEKADAYIESLFSETESMLNDSVKIFKL